MFEPSISVKKKKTQVHEFGLFTFFFCLTVNATQHGSIKKKKNMTYHLLVKILTIKDDLKVKI
jgi:hypothetical protein